MTIIWPWYQSLEEFKDVRTLGFALCKMSLTFYLVNSLKYILWALFQPKLTIWGLIARFSSTFTNHFYDSDKKASLLNENVLNSKEMSARSACSFFHNYTILTPYVVVCGGSNQLNCNFCLLQLEARQTTLCQHSARLSWTKPTLVEVNDS